MRHAAPARSGPSPARDDPRTSRQIRRFGLLWLLATVGVMAAVWATSSIAGGFREQADRQAAAAIRTELAAAHAAADISSLVNARTAYNITGGRSQYDGYRLRSQRLHDDLRSLRAAIDKQGLEGTDARLAAATLRDVHSWLDSTDQAMGGSSFDHRSMLPPVRDPAIDREAELVLSQLNELEQSLPAESGSAIARSRQAAANVDAIRQVVMLTGLLVLLALGVHLVRRAYRLAAEADEHRSREESWREQMEAVLAWSVRAKSATTRSQLIGFANLAPRDAMGASCFLVSEGAAPAHASHGLPRVALKVDDAGRGLHVSVCFAEHRGDTHDHHSLDLLLGHLSALWRTVLRHEELERAAGHDALTGLPNRRTFEAELKRRAAVWKRRGLGFTVAMVDLDHFKLVNDRFGHPEGDAVLRRTGEAIRESLRHDDRVFRFGGEEFVLILETTDPAGVEELLERARQAIRALGVEPEAGRRLSISIGWALFGEDAQDRDGVIARADAALYAAKRGGRDRVVRGSDLAA